MALSIQIIQAPPTERVLKREFYLNDFPANIGRGYSSDVCLADHSGEMSRSHIVIFKLSTGRYQVMDLSANGATLNGAKIQLRTARPLVDGDVLGFSGYKLLVSILAFTAADDELAQGQVDLDVEADYSPETPLMAGAEFEGMQTELGCAASPVESNLGRDLMFDPFADGPKIHGNETQMVEEVWHKSSENDISEIVQLPALRFKEDALSGAPSTALQESYFKNQLNDVIERTVERFLDEVDPSILQKDYDEYIPRFSRRKSRYWVIHVRQFAKCKLKGDYISRFKSLFAEELRKS